MIDTAVIPVAGLGTRLLPFTKEQPKEMLPLFVEGGIKPIVQVIFEQLYSAGIRKFIFIVGRGKRAIQDHFSPDYPFVEFLKNKGKDQYAKNLDDFYEKIENSSIVWINQAQPKGFGHAVSLARPYVVGEHFFVHAGDTFITNSEGKNFVKEMIVRFNDICNNLDDNATFSYVCIRRIEDKELLKQYGVASVDSNSNITKVVEKPAHPDSNLAIMPLYIFQRKIFDMVERTMPGVSNEIQLTDAIEQLIKVKGKVLAHILDANVVRMDVGTPETYFDAIQSSILMAKLGIKVQARN